MTEVAPVLVPRRNYWAVTSLVCGILGFALALTAPIPFVPIISIFNWPLGLIALLTGWVGLRQAKAHQDASATARVQWGVRLGCAGWVIQFVTSTIKVLILAGFLTYLIGTAVNQWLATATPIP